MCMERGLATGGQKGSWWITSWIWGAVGRGAWDDRVKSRALAQGLEARNLIGRTRLASFPS